MLPDEDVFELTVYADRRDHVTSKPTSRRPPLCARDFLSIAANASFHRK